MSKLADSSSIPLIGVLLYGCESWTFNADIEKDFARLNSIATGDSSESLTVPAHQRVASHGD